MDEETVESAKAVQEIAKTTSKAIDAGSELGGFLVKIFGESVADAAGLLGGDWLHFYRRERVLLLANKSNQRLQKRGIKQTVPLPPKIALPLLENASLEEDDNLMDMWANLLASSLDPENEYPAQKHHVDILCQLSGPEAGLLQVLWEKSVSSEAMSDERQIEEGVKKLEETKVERWRHYNVATQKLAIHNVTRLRLAAFELEPINTDDTLLLDTINNYLSGRAAHTVQELVYTDGRKLNPAGLEQLIHKIQMQFLVSNGSLEPNPFQQWIDPEDSDRYANPEEGMHLIPTGYFLMKACQP